jgi:hypothetical protein
VQTHRDPVVCVASACSLNATTSRGWSTVFEGSVIGAATLGLLSREAALFAQARERYDPMQFADVEYDDLVADPVGTTRSIYASFDLPWDDVVAAHVSAAHTASVSGTARPAHRYSLGDYGLTEAQVRAHF